MLAAFFVACVHVAISEAGKHRAAHEVFACMGTLCRGAVRRG
jgi:hypothetical protein